MMTNIKLHSKYVSQKNTVLTEIQNVTKAFFILTLVLLVSGCSQKNGTSDEKEIQNKKIRVIHTSDLVRDDENTLVRLFLFANDQEILGIHSSASPWSDTGVIKKVLRHIDLYEKVYNNLKKHDSAYPTPDYLRSVTMAGNEVANDYLSDTPGSLNIKDVLLDHSNNDPVWVTCWGGPATVTAALRYINDNNPDEKAYVAKKLKIYFVGRQEGTEETYQKEQPCMDYINSHYNPVPEMLTCETYNYMNYWGHQEFWFDNVKYSTREWVKQNYNTGNGPLCADFEYYDTGDCDGDAPAMLHLLGTYYGLRSTENPAYGGWGSRFSSWPNNNNRYVNWDEESLKIQYIADAYQGDTITRNWYQRMHYSGARWNDDIQNELAVRASWCVKDYNETNHPPVVNLTVAQDIVATPDETIELTCAPTDPDGDKLSCSWWQYKEAGTCNSTISINNSDTNSASFVCPAEPGKTIHIILEVQDNGKGHPLTRYARVIVKIKNNSN